MTYLIDVPGNFTREMAFLDIETRKVPTSGFTMRNGEPLKNRWQVFLVGVGRDGQIVLVDEYGRAGHEEATLTATAKALNGHRTVAYSATREFDEMVLRGRFTNARRAHEVLPFYPAMPGADRLDWRNMRKEPGALLNAVRSHDVDSVKVPDFWVRGNRQPVLVHLLRDVVELILRYGDPDQACRNWCQAVLIDYIYATRYAS